MNRKIRQMRVHTVVDKDRCRPGFYIVGVDALQRWRGSGISRMLHGRRAAHDHAVISEPLQGGGKCSGQQRAIRDKFRNQ